MSGRYDHTQRGPLCYLLAAIAAGFAATAIFVPHPAVTVVHAVLAVVVFAAAFCFAHLTVRDEGEQLAIRFGPVPLFARTIPYAEITGVERARSDILDGLGIHWVPWRGWIYNLWGFDCVKLTVKGKPVRIGTDDPDGLVEFLRARIAEAEVSTGSAIPEPT